MAKKDIITIGASAGGIEVLQTILPSLPWDLQASIFIVVHTNEDGPGLLPEVLNRSSKLPVLFAINDAPILPARVYVAPGGPRHLMLDRGKVRLQPGPRENGHRPSVDALFRTASYAYGTRVIGVVLTGNLDDGSAGLADIKRRGGSAIVQDPEDASVPSMPENAIETTQVDYVLPAQAIGPKLIELAASDASDVQPISSEAHSELAPTGSTYACPECGGVLEESKEGGLLRFRCRVGHVYSPESLLADQNLAVEKALWAAIRSLEERAEFATRLAGSSRQKQHTRIAGRFKEKAEESRVNASVLRELLEKTAEEIPSTSERRTGT